MPRGAAQRPAVEPGAPRLPRRTVGPTLTQAPHRIRPRPCRRGLRAVPSSNAPRADAQGRGEEIARRRCVTCTRASSVAGGTRPRVGTFRDAEAARLGEGPIAHGHQACCVWVSKRDSSPVFGTRGTEGEHRRSRRGVPPVDVAAEFGSTWPTRIAALRNVLATRRTVVHHTPQCRPAPISDGTSSGVVLAIAYDRPRNMGPARAPLLSEICRRIR
jgi:hypothetical protein